MPGGGHVTRTVEVLRPGTFVPMTGDPVTFSEADLRALAAAYDGATAPAPAVVGHPRLDAPAYAWAKSFSWDAASQRLVADLGEIEPTFADAVSAGRYKKISLSLFAPTAPNNPKPGTWYPKHIGFLGGAAPAVPGLKPVSFAEGETGVLTFEFADAAALRDVAGLFWSLREWIIEKFGAEAADKSLPNWTIGWIEDAGRDPPTEAGFAAPTPTPTPKPAKTPETPMPDNGSANAADVALAARAQALDDRERAANHADNASFAERLVTEGRLLPALKDKVIGLLDSLSPVAGSQLEVSFAEGAETRKSGALDLVKDVLAKQPAVVSFGAVDLGPDVPSVDFAMPGGMSADPGSAELHARAVAYQAAHPGTDYMAAVAAVKR